MSGSILNQLQRFFLHYPEGHRLYVCIVDQQRRAFDFSDNTFKAASKLASIKDACLYATGRYESRADHGYSYSVEIDLARLLAGTDPETSPAENAAVTVHWLRQKGDHPDVSVDARLGNTCLLRYDGGRFEVANPHNRERLDENLAFENRAKAAKAYTEFVLREIDSQKPRYERLAAAVQAGNVAATLRVLAQDLCFWAGNLKPHLLHQLSHSAKDPTFARMSDVPKNASFQFLDTWIVRDWLGSHEAFDLLEFHKNAEYARNFAARLDHLHETRVEFAQLVNQYIVQHRGENVEGIIGLDELRKEIKHQALCLAEHIDLIAAQFDAVKDPSPAQKVDRSGPKPGEAQVTTLLGEFAHALGAYTSALNQIVIDANHPQIASFEDAVNWITRRQSELDAARKNVERLAGKELVAVIVPPDGASGEQWTIQLLAMVAESYNAISYVFTSGPPRPTSDDPRATMAASVVAQQLGTASKLIRELESRRRYLEAVGQARRTVGIPEIIEAAKPAKEDRTSIDAKKVVQVPAAETESRSFSGGEIAFHRDRVEICGVDICSGLRCGSKRVVLELLSRRRNDGSFIPYSGEDLEAEAKLRGARGTAAGWIRDLRDDIMERLRTQANIISGHKDVILSGDRGYRFAESLAVLYIDPPSITDITDTEDVRDVRDDDVRDVFDVRDDASGARRAWILQQLGEGKRLKAAAVAEEFECSEKTALRDFAALKEQGAIEFVGEARTGYYRLCQAPKTGQ